jgi:serine/threonine protein kinase
LYALVHIHDQNIVHKDLKPKNILLQSTSTDGTAVQPIIADFGISKVSDSSGQTDNIGTIEFQSFNKLQLQESPSGWHDDVWSLGCCFALIAVFLNCTAEECDDFWKRTMCLEIKTARKGVFDRDETRTLLNGLLENGSGVGLPNQLLIHRKELKALIDDMLLRDLDKRPRAKVALEQVMELDHQLRAMEIVSSVNGLHVWMWRGNGKSVDGHMVTKILQFPKVLEILPIHEILRLGSKIFTSKRKTKPHFWQLGVCQSSQAESIFETPPIPIENMVNTSPWSTSRPFYEALLEATNPMNLFQSYKSDIQVGIILS